MVTLYKRGPVWWVAVNRNGVQERRSLKTRDKVVAEALRRKIELDVLSGGALTPISWDQYDAEFRQWISPQVGYRTEKSYAFTADRFGRFLKNIHIFSIDEISPGTVASYIEERKRDVHPYRKRTMTDGGVRYELRNLHRIFGYAVECGYTKRNPVIAGNLNAIAGRTQPFSDAELRAMLANLDVRSKPHLRAIILLFTHTGLRIGDVIHLQKDSLVDGTLLLKTRKRGTVVRVHIHPELAAALDVHFQCQNEAQRVSPHVFSTEFGKPMVSLDKYLRRVWKSCGIVNAHAHRFRDTFAVRLLAKGASLFDVCKMMGISQRTAELHYTPYVKELQIRAANLIGMVDPIEPATPADESDRVIQFPRKAG